METLTVSDPVLCPLDHLGLIAFTGEDAQSFLQGQLTNDVRLISADRSQLAGYCTAKGRLLATFLLWKTNDGYCGQLHGAIAATVQKRLGLYVLRAKVSITDVAARWGRLGIAGTDCVTLLEACFGSLPQQPMDTLRHEDITLIRLHDGGTPRFQIIAPAHTIPALRARFERDCRMVEPAYWEWLEIRAGIPQIGPGTQEEFVPQMVNLDLLDGISFKKGCYIGQEIVARTHYLGKVKRRTHLAHVDVAQPPPAGTAIYGTTATEPAGMVINAAMAPAGGCDLLAEIQLDRLAGPLHLGSSEGPRLALLPLPYDV
ncbi:MAG: folate-binding protein [Methylophilaceae bacterium]|nr:folate-binding protein [Methylophilaceae bacterium]